MEGIGETAVFLSGIFRIENVIEINWHYLLLIIGIVQGIFFTLALWTKNNKEQLANRMLALLSLVLALLLLATFLGKVTKILWLAQHTALLWPVAFMIGPLLWWYAESTKNPNFKFSYKQLIHLVPTDISLLTILLISALSAKQQIHLVIAGQEHNLWSLFRTVLILGFLSHSGIYIGKTVQVVKQLKQAVAADATLSERQNFRWLNYLVFISLAIWGLFLLSQIIVGQTGEVLRIWATIEIVAILFAIGFFATRQTSVEVVTPTANLLLDRDLKKVVKYQTSPISSVQADMIQRQLLTLMEKQKPYREGKLTIADLASQLNIQPNYLSQVINEKLNRNFYDFVNGYRVEEAKQRLLAEPERTILDIALDSGFNSKSVFYKVFKQQCGMTPSQFRDENT